MQKMLHMRWRMKERSPENEWREEIKENSYRRRWSCAPELLGSCPTKPVLTARVGKNAALDFTPNKVNDNPPYTWKNKGYCFVSPRWALFGTSLTEAYGEIQLTSMCFRRTFVSERYSGVLWRRFFLACAKHLHLLSVVQDRCSCLAALRVLLCTQGQAALPWVPLVSSDADAFRRL